MAFERFQAQRAMNIFFLSMSPSEAARFHANIHVVKMIATCLSLGFQQLRLGSGGNCAAAVQRASQGQGSFAIRLIPPRGTAVSFS